MLDLQTSHELLLYYVKYDFSTLIIRMGMLLVATGLITYFSLVLNRKILEKRIKLPKDYYKAFEIVIGIVIGILVGFLLMLFILNYSNGQLMKNRIVEVKDSQKYDRILNIKNLSKREGSSYFPHKNRIDNLINNIFKDKILLQYEYNLFDSELSEIKEKINKQNNLKKIKEIKE